MHVEQHRSTASGSGNLVLLHGWAMHSDIWQPVLPALQQRYHIWCIDLPGHGKAAASPWPEQPLELVAQIAEQVPADSLWVGWSMGGLFALQAARQNLCAALTLVACNPRFVTAPHWPHGVADDLFVQFGDDLESDFDRALRRFLALEVHGSEAAKTQLLQLQKQVFIHGRPSIAALRGGLDLLQTADFSSCLTDLTLPSLIIGGRRDRLVPWPALEQAAAALPTATLVRIPGAGHAPFIGAPELFAEALLSWSEHV